jgi:uncharacterized membrane protein YciS (DUF1049 family)
MSQAPQSFEQHAKMVPLYHYWGTAFLVIPTLYFAYAAVTDFSFASLLMFVFGVGVIIAALFARIFALGVQDRVIRLEERLRMERLLPDELRPRIEQVTTDQLVGLRFASDGELVELTRRVLDGELTDRKSIKRAVKSWRPDHQRV